MEVWEGMTVVRKCDSPKEVCQLVGRCDGHGEIYRGSGGASLGRKCDSHQGGVKCIKNECQLMERCDGHGGGVWRYGKVRQLTGSVTVIREV